jgi:hypothetical protein
MSNSRPRPTICAYCGGPLPPPALTGRPRTFCSAQCRRANESVVVSGRREEMQRRERERLQAEWEAREKARQDKAERDYQRALKAGGRVTAEARWERLYDEALDAGRYGLCQWEDEIDGHYVHTCFSRTADVYCWRHNRESERETKRARKLQEPSEAHLQGHR